MSPHATSPATGDVDLTHPLQDADNPTYELYLYGWAAGWEARQAEIDRLTRTLDRQYVTMWNPIQIDPNQPTFAELLRRRGDPERAAQVEADLAALLGEVRP